MCYHILLIETPTTTPHEVRTEETLLMAIMQAHAIADATTRQKTERHWTPVGEYFTNEERVGTIVMDDKQLQRFNNKQNHQRRRNEEHCQA